MRLTRYRESPFIARYFRLPPEFATTFTGSTILTHSKGRPIKVEMGIDEQTIQEIVRRILTVTRPDKIILFGSAATGQMTRDSDIDLLIVEPDTSNQRREYVEISKALWEIQFPVDLIFITTQWFEDSKNVIGGIAYPANKAGRVIYEAAA